MIHYIPLAIAAKAANISAPLSLMFGTAGMMKPPSMAVAGLSSGAYVHLIPLNLAQSMEEPDASSTRMSMLNKSCKPPRGIQC